MNGARVGRHAAPSPSIRLPGLGFIAAALTVWATPAALILGHEQAGELLATPPLVAAPDIKQPT